MGMLGFTVGVRNPTRVYKNYKMRGKKKKTIFAFDFVSLKVLLNFIILSKIFSSTILQVFFSFLLISNLKYIIWTQ
jgi:hypothetical protein